MVCHDISGLHANYIPTFHNSKLAHICGFLGFSFAKCRGLLRLKCFSKENVMLQKKGLHFLMVVLSYFYNLAAHLSHGAKLFFCLMRTVYECAGKQPVTGVLVNYNVRKLTGPMCM